MTDVPKRSRIWEVDFLRGVALILMVYFHVVFTMNELFGYSVNYSSGVNFYIGRMSAVIFIIVSGISCSFSKSNVKRGLKVLGIAMVITAATYLYDPDFVIKFGILHFLGISMLLYHVLRKVNKYILLVSGILIIVFGADVSNISVAHNYLFPFGITSSSFASADYYPLIPWFGVFLIGVALGRLIYYAKESKFSFNLENNIISRIGQKTLIVYVIHQPLIIGVLVLINLFN